MFQLSIICKYKNNPTKGKKTQLKLLIGNNKAAIWSPHAKLKLDCLASHPLPEKAFPAKNSTNRYLRELRGGLVVIHDCYVDPTRKEK